MLSMKKYYFSKKILAGISLLLGLWIIIFVVNSRTQIKTHHLAKNITAIVQEHALRYDIDKRSIDSTVVESTSTPLEGLADVQSKIAMLVAQNKPIEFNLVGFPYKSQNTERKVLVPHLDAAEKHSLNYLNSFLNKIAKIYKPGAHLTIFTDGTIFCDIEGVDDKIVMDYEKQLKKTATGLKHIHIKTMADLLPNKSPAKMREFIQQHAPSISSFEALLSSPAQQEELALLEKRTAFEFNHAAGLAKLKNTSIAAISKKILHRGLQYSTFLSQFRPNEAIRLSVHYQPNVSKKLGIKLSHNSFVTPWHGVLVTHANGSARIEHLEEVLQSSTPSTQAIRRRA